MNVINQSLTCCEYWIDEPVYMLLVFVLRLFRMGFKALQKFDSPPALFFFDQGGVSLCDQPGAISLPPLLLSRPRVSLTDKALTKGEFTV